MTQFSGKTVVAINHLTVDNDTATYTCTQSNHDKIFHTTCSTISHFTDSCGVSVVSQCSRYTQALLEHSCQRYYTFPRQVGGKFDSTAVVVTIGSTDTDTFDFIYTAISDNQRQQILADCIYIIICLIVSAGFDGTACNNSSACIHNTKDGVCSAYVNTYYVGFFHA